MFRARPPFAPRAPDFLCVGTQRAGTTWLYHCLDRSPGFAMPPVKELNAFRTGPGAQASLVRQRRQFLALLHQEHAKPEPDLATLRWYARFTLDEPRDTAWYHQLFAHAGPRVTGEVSPSLFCAAPTTIARVLQAAPEAHILVMLRDPLDRVRSHARFAQAKGWWPAELDDEGRFRSLTTGLGGGFSDYAGALRRWEAAFPERVSVFFLEDAARAPAQTLSRIGAVLDTPLDAAALGPLATARLNAAPAGTLSPALEARLARWLRPRVEPLVDRWPERVGGWLERLDNAENALK
jgi:hypothetical protein